MRPSMRRPKPSKNLYNQAMYQFRQAYIHEGRYLTYAAVFHRVKHLDCYQALPRKVSNSILILIDKNWRSFRNALAAWNEHPEKFTGRPSLPGYKPKEKGRNILIYDVQAIGKRAFQKTGKLVPSGLGIEIETQVKWEALDQIRIIPRGSCYVIEVVYQKEEKPAAVDPALVAAIDLGVNQLAAITSSKPGFVPRLVNGRPLKDLNHFYNQQRAHLQSQLARQNRTTSRKLEKITRDASSPRQRVFAHGQPSHHYHACRRGDRNPGHLIALAGHIVSVDSNSSVNQTLPLPSITRPS